AGYTYDNKYTATASARIDDSNLFGSDPKYRYLPMWSLGGSWNISKEEFMASAGCLDALTIRATYGINGNVVRKVGPFLQAEAIYNPEAEETGTRILFPPNRSLRWEKTAVTNFGISFSIFDNKLSGTIDYYNKYTTDLLGTKELDPTNAFQSSLVNYGSMINRGIEVGLNSTNIRTRSFSWTTMFNISYNKNRMTEISAGSESLASFTDGFGCDRVGYPMGSLFNYRWAGLNPENGTPMVYNKNGEIIENCDASGNPQYNVTDKGDVFYAGTIHPKYTIGFNNTFTWKNLSATVVMIANGGNVMRDAVPMIHVNGYFDQNVTKTASNFWREPGDENKKGVMPAPDISGNGSASYGTLWTAADINTVKADYIKVRSISLAYDFPSNIFGREYFSKARLTFQIQNPLKWVANDRGLDPEAYYAASISAERTLPVTTSYIIGLNITF
ncbi:MAG: hypothetical protein PHS19_06380, partial [Eubacteriales bacterium]|nr:hypothetical protein [Eubacteriales bacterium]